jgi:hypothetical protein
MFKLMCASLVVMVGNAEAERVFSCQNRVKVKSRQLICIEQLDKLMRVSFSGPPLEEFNFGSARDTYLQSPRRL